MILLMLFIAVLFIEWKFSPRVEYLEKESLLILFFTANTRHECLNTRKRLIFKI